VAAALRDRIVADPASIGEPTVIATEKLFIAINESFSPAE
jgi:hypothetical protein